MTAAISGPLVRVAAVEQLPPGAIVDVEVDGWRLALVNQDGAVYAVQRDCTHAAGPLTEGGLAPGCLLQCPWHGAVFDVRTGQVRRGPARKPLRTYPVEVVDGAVLVALPAECGGPHEWPQHHSEEISHSDECNLGLLQHST